MNTPTILMILLTAFLLVYSFYLSARLSSIKNQQVLLVKAHIVDIKMFTRFVNDNDLIEDYANFCDELIKKEVNNG